MTFLELAWRLNNRCCNFKLTCPFEKPWNYDKNTATTTENFRTSLLFFAASVGHIFELTFCFVRFKYFSRSTYKFRGRFFVRKVNKFLESRITLENKYFPFFLIILTRNSYLKLFTVSQQFSLLLRKHLDCIGINQIFWKAFGKFSDFTRLAAFPVCQPNLGRQNLVIQIWTVLMAQLNWI